jgi:hypothetical protein
MRQALQSILLELRAEFPDAIIVANSSESWRGVNGELNEARPGQLEEELAPFAGHERPAIDLYQSVLRGPNDLQTLHIEMARVHALGGYYGANVDSTRVLWFEEFERVIDAYKGRSA